MLESFLRLPDVIRATGFSKSEIYRKVAERRFPAPRRYRDNPRKCFWLASEISAWQMEQITG